MGEETIVKELKGIEKRLDAVIGLLFENAGRTDKFSLRDRIRVLDSCGLAPSEIADIVGTSGNYVNVQLSLMRKGPAKRAEAKTRKGD